MNKRGIEMSFAWLFAILIGAFIIAGAIYGAIQIAKGGQYRQNVFLAKDLSVILNPLDTGLSSGKSTQADLAVEARVYNKCTTDGSFGTNKFSVAEKSGFVKEWGLPGGEISVYNRYVFSEKITQAKTLYLVPLPFEMPFKVSEIVMLYGNQYCFNSAPEIVKEKFKDLKLKNIKFKEEGNCTGKETSVCFNSNCNISVVPLCTGNCDSEYDYGYTEKNGKREYFVGNLLYASIFSDPEIYSCNVKRLMMRLQKIAFLYNDEVAFITRAGCTDVMSINLLNLAQLAGNVDSENEMSLLALKEAAEKLDNQNTEQRGCRIYG